MVNNPNTNTGGPKGKNPVSLRVLVAYSRAITQLVSIRRNNACGTTPRQRTSANPKPRRQQALACRKGVKI